MCTEKENKQQSPKKKRTLSREARMTIYKILVPIAGAIELLWKLLVWLIVIAIIVVLTRLTEGNWQELANILFGELTLASVLRDALLVLVGGLFINSIKKAIQNFRKRGEWIKWGESRSTNCRKLTPLFLCKFVMSL